jgi:hypothetical protein
VRAIVAGDLLDPDEAVWEIKMDYHGEFIEILEDAVLFCVSVDDIPADWAGLVRLTGQVDRLADVLENWGPIEDWEYGNGLEDDEFVPSWQDYVRRYGRIVGVL